MAVITGSLELLGTQTQYEVTSFADGTVRSRELTLHRGPLTASELLKLMGIITPTGPSDSAGGIKFDMAQTLVRGKGAAYNSRLDKGHAAAFPDAWAVMRDHATVLYDHLPLSPTEKPPFKQGHLNILSLIGSIRNKRIRGELFSRHLAGEELAKPIIIKDDRSVELPDSPLVVIENSSGVPAYFNAHNIRRTPSGVEQAPRKVDVDQIVTAIFTNHQKEGIVPIWETSRTSSGGIIPVIFWTRTNGGESVFRHTSPSTETVPNGTLLEHVSKSSLVGSLVLAACSPAVTESWPKSRGYHENSKRKQIIGPLQASLLAVIDIEKIMQADFIQAIERDLAQAC